MKLDRKSDAGYECKGKVWQIMIIYMYVPYLLEKVPRALFVWADEEIGNPLTTDWPKKIIMIIHMRSINLWGTLK